MTSYPPADGAPPTGAGAVPVCPRHPDRESYVRCQRCERPVCPECQRAAAVGVQCVDCVKAGARTGRVARNVFGGRVSTRPVVTQSIIGITVAVYVLQWVLGTDFTFRFAFAGYYALEDPWRFLTSAFLHSTSFLLHIVFNMYALWLIGPYLEQLLGRGRFLALYLISGIGGSVGYFLLVPPLVDGTTVTWAVGASGAVFGLFGAMLVLNRALGRDNSALFIVIGINFVIGFLPGIAWQAHLGGLVTGAACAAVLARPRTPRRTAVQMAGLVGVCLVLVVLVLARAAALPAGSLA